MIEVDYYEYSPAGIMKTVRELRENGLVQGKDFDFSYNPYTFRSPNESEQCPATFRFYKAKHATWFSLKYG